MNTPKTRLLIINIGQICNWWPKGRI